MTHTTSTNEGGETLHESGHYAEERAQATDPRLQAILDQARRYGEETGKLLSAYDRERAAEAADPKRRVLRTIDRALAAEEEHAARPSAAWSQYNDAMERTVRVVDDQMRRRHTVADTMHGVYAAPSIGGAAVLSHAPLVLRGDTGELRLRLLPVAPDDAEHPVRGGPWPVTQVAVFEPHDVAVLVTPNDLFIMSARELFAQLGDHAPPA